MDFQLLFLFSVHFYCFCIFFFWEKNPWSSILLLHFTEVPSVWLQVLQGRHLLHWGSSGLFRCDNHIIITARYLGQTLLEWHYFLSPRGAQRGSHSPRCSSVLVRCWPGGWSLLPRSGMGGGSSCDAALPPAPAPSASTLSEPLGHSLVPTVRFWLRGRVTLGYPVATAHLFWAKNLAR